MLEKRKGSYHIRFCSPHSVNNIHCESKICSPNSKKDQSKSLPPTILIVIGEQAMESDHCLSHRKHPSTLFNTFISLLFIYSNTNIISYTTSLVTFTASSPPHSFLKHFSTVTNCIKIQHSTHHTSKLSPRPWLMAPPARSYPSHGLKLPITVLFIFFFSLLPSKSGKNPPPPSYPI